MKIQTTRFGTIDVKEAQVLTLVEGMLGFSECSRYVLMDDEIGEPFMPTRRASKLRKSPA